MNTLTALPWMYEPYMKDCWASMSPRFQSQVIPIDNRPIENADRDPANYGIMRSHNIVAKMVLAEQFDWLIVLSAAVRFKRPGGNDFLEALEQQPDDMWVLEAAGVFGWHLIAFRRAFIEQVGLWDENFTPYGYDDIDLSIRYQIVRGQSGFTPLWDKVEGQWSDEGMAHSHKLGGLEVSSGHNASMIDYFIAKWGRHPGDYKEPYFQHPFNAEHRDVTYWPGFERAGQW